MKKKKTLFISIFAVWAVVLIIGGIVLVRGLDNPRVVFDTTPESEVTVNCFSEYKAPEVKAVYRGYILTKKGTPLEVTRKGEVDLTKPGDYVVEFVAEKNGDVKSVKQTVHVVDGTPPVITLVPETRTSIAATGKYDDPGFSAKDDVSGDLTDRVKVEVKATSVVYTVTDDAGNTATVERKVPFYENVAPVLALKGDTELSVYSSTKAFEDPGYTASDNSQGDLTAEVVVTGTVDTGTPGVYELTYTVTDAYGNKAEAKRTVTVNENPAPTINLKGLRSMYLLVGSEFSEPGYTAEQALDGDLTDKVTVSGSVKTDTKGEYELTYTVTDSFGHTSTATRKVTVADAQDLKQPYNFGDGEVPSEKVVYLTFDDGPGAHTMRLLDILDKYNVKVTFFVVSYGYEDIIGEEFRRGHSIGVHSIRHDFYNIYASEDAYFADLNGMNEIIHEQTGVYTNLMRFPGGSSNTISSFNPGIMTRLTKLVEEAGWSYFDWNVSASDAGGTESSEQVYWNVVSGIEARGGEPSVVLMHDVKGYTVDTVENIIIWCIQNGYTLLPLNANSPTAHHPILN